MYDEEDDRPNVKLEKKINRDRQHNETEEDKKKSNDKNKSEKPKKITDSSSKFRNFIDDDVPQSSGLPKQSNTNHDQSKPKKNQHSSETLKENQKTSHPRSPSKCPKRLSSPVTKPQVASSKKIKREIKYKPFHKLLEGVTMAISGIQVRSVLFYLNLS